MNFPRLPFACLSLAFSLCGGAALFGAPKTYLLDPGQSSIGFTSSGVFTKVPGSFAKFEGGFTFGGENPERSTLSASVDVSSIDTADAKRDVHLKSADFFDVAKFPTATFRSKLWKKTGANTYEILGDLTLHGATREVSFHVTSLLVGPGKQPGSTVSQWLGSAAVKRSDFGVNGSAILGKMIGDGVAISIKVTAVTKD